MTRVGPFRRLVVLGFALTLVIGACSDDDGDEASTSTAAGPTEITFAFAGPLSGDDADVGAFVRNGARIAIDEASAEGGDHQFFLQEWDTQGDPAQAPTVTNELIGDERIIGVVGPTFSEETKAVLPALEKAGLAMISPAATGRDLPTVVTDGKVFHRTMADDSHEGRALGARIVEDLRAEAVVVVHDDSEYGKGLAADTEAAVVEAGGSVASTEVVGAAQDLPAAVNSIKARNPDVVVYAGDAERGGLLRKQLTDAGVGASFVGGHRLLEGGFTEAAAGAAEGSLIACPCKVPTATSPGKLGELYNAYQQFEGDPGIYVAEAYDATRILIEGVRAGNTTREDLLDWLEDDFESFDGASKSVAFEENGNVTVNEIYLFEVKDGSFVLRENEEAG